MTNGIRLQNHIKRSKFCVVMICLMTATIVFSILSLILGSVHIQVSDIFDIILGGGDENESYIVLGIRLPRIVMALILGGALSLSGFLLQTYFENPIAGPYVLGISSGARMVVSFVMVFFLFSLGKVSSWVLIIASFMGSLLVTAVIIFFAGRLRSMATLLVAGIMVGYICTAVSEFIITFADDNDIVNLHGWTQGSFAGTGWEQVLTAAVVVLPVSVITFLMSKQIGAFLLGERYAASMGLSVRKFRLIIIILSSILSATVTAFAGPVSFVGIAVPIVIRSVLKTSDPIYVIPSTFVCGSAFCVICDLIARQIMAPTELMLSNITAVFGAPIVIAAMIKRGRNRE